MYSEKKFPLLLKCYRHDVPFVGTITEEKAQELLKKEEVCRGWVLGSTGLEYFHIIKSPSNYPEFSLFTAEDKETLLRMTAILCIQHQIEFEQIFIK